MAYVYRHIRLDKNEPFYIGIGENSKKWRRGKYSRAYSTHSRNKYWRNIVSVSDYDVEIIIDNIPWEIALEKEIEFISLYKRKKDGGTLANLTLGGDGVLGVSTQAWNKGKKHPSSTIEKFLKSMEGRFLKGENHPNFGKKMLDHVKEKLKEANRNRTPWNKGKCGYKVASKTKQMKVVIKYDLDMNYITEFNSALEAANSINTKTSNISNVCTGRNKSHYGFIWRYKHEKPRFKGRKVAL